MRDNLDLYLPCKVEKFDDQFEAYIIKCNDHACLSLNSTFDVVKEFIKEAAKHLYSTDLDHICSLTFRNMRESLNIWVGYDLEQVFNHTQRSAIQDYSTDLAKALGISKATCFDLKSYFVCTYSGFEGKYLSCMAAASDYIDIHYLFGYDFENEVNKAITKA